MRSEPKSRSLTALLLIVAAVASSTAAATTPRIGAKQAEAGRVLAEIDALDARLAQASEAYDGATYRLGLIRNQLRLNRSEMHIAAANLRIAQQRLAQRLRDLYTSSDDDTTLAIVLGTKTLDQAIEAVDVKNRISSEDTEVLREVQLFHASVGRQRHLLGAAMAAQQRLVAERAAAKGLIERGLRARRGLLASIRSQIATLRREEAARQAELAAEARARLAEQQQRQTQALRSIVVGATAESPGSGNQPSASVLPPSPVGSQVVSIAVRYLGDPYVWAAAGPSTFDCSGLVLYVYAQVGISLPHFAAAQWTYGVYVPRDQLQPGDLVFFENLNHVGIYVGNGDYIQAPQPGDVVKITPLSDPWSAANYYGAKRIIG